MVGLSIEKLLVVAVIAALVIGPQRLPMYAARLGQLIRGLRSVLDSARAAAEREAGTLVPSDTWSESLRQYDPRVIVRDALREPATVAAQPADEPATEPDPMPSLKRHSTVSGSSGHPRRRVAPPADPDGGQPASGSTPSDSTAALTASGTGTGRRVSEST